MNKIGILLPQMGYSNRGDNMSKEPSLLERQRNMVKKSKQRTAKLLKRAKELSLKKQRD